MSWFAIGNFYLTFDSKSISPWTLSFADELYQSLLRSSLRRSEIRLGLVVEILLRSLVGLGHSWRTTLGTRSIGSEKSSQYSFSVR